MSRNQHFTNEQINRATRAAALTTILVENSTNNGGVPPETAEQFTKGLDSIVDWFIGGPASEERAHKAIDLANTLVNDYPSFQEVLFEASASESPSPIRRLAERLVSSGAVDETTTFAEGQRLFEDAQNNAGDGAGA